MQTVLLTGATGDIGGAILKKYSDEGCRVIAPDRKTLDLASQDSIRNYMSSLSEEIDVLVHCAGFNNPKLMGELSEADISSVFQVNTLSFYSMSHYLLKNFMKKKSGSIIGISSIYGDFSRKGRLAYAASKHALNGMIKTMALELGQHNVKVNGVSPGFVDTKLTSKNNSVQIIENLRKKIPLGRLASVEDIASVVYFLSSSQNNYINGQCLVVDGGYSVGGFQNE